MPQVVNTNIMSINAQRNLTKSQKGQALAFQRLSSGKRINSAADDAAGLAIANRMESQIRGTEQAIRNANDGVSVAQTAEGALSETSTLLQRMRELAIQAANDSNSTSDRKNLQKEVDELKNEINRIANNTQFNGKNLLDGTFSSQKFHVGANADQTINVSIDNAHGTSLGAHQVNAAGTKDHVGAALAAATDGTAGNNVAADVAFKITGDGSSTLSIAGDATAAKIASQINNESATTGVSASASNSVVLDTVASAGAITFTLKSQDESQATVGTAASISATVAATTDVSALRDAINAETAKTGITATLSAGGDAITLSNDTGHDIVVENADNGDASDDAVFNVGGVTLTDNGAGGTNNDSIVVGGKISLSSTQSFLVETTATDILAATSTASTLNAVSAIDVTNQSGANAALQVIDEALSSISSSRADLGAKQNRLQSTISNLSSVAENTRAARSRIEDADFAVETANLTRNQILQQAGTTVLAQANQTASTVLGLLG